MASRRKFDLAVAVDPRSTLSLQHQLRQKLVDAINRGVLRPGRRLPSSRQLATQAGVSRNTVTLAYDALLAEGHLVSRPRSGIYVAKEVPGERVTTGRRGLSRFASATARLSPAASDDSFRRPPNWDQYPFPFLDGCIDSSLLALDEWREALRLAFARQAVSRWSIQGEHDDPLFVEELRTKWLPAWGVDAAPDEVVVTASPRHALHLAIEVLVQRGTPVLLAYVPDGDVRRQLLDRHATLLPFARGSDVLKAAQDVPPGGVIIHSAHAFAAHDAAHDRAQALLQLASERDVLIIEVGAAPELRDSRRSALSLRAFDTLGRVTFVGGLSPVAALGTPPGFINADARVVDRARRARTLAGTEFAPGVQRAWAYFIGLGHYGACMARAHRALALRRTALRDALNHYLHKFVTIESVPGSSAYHVRGPDGMNALELARAAQSLGVLIDPSNDPERPEAFSMGVTSLPKESVRGGVEVLSRLIRGDRRLGSRLLSDDPLQPMSGRALQRELAGKTLLYNTVYGEPCTIELRAGGELIGRAGYANEDCDRGRWWIEDDRWFRQWQNWAYGEALGLFTVIDGDQVRWFNTDGLLIDTALIVRGKRR
ncbi:MAG TPA: PLP-dependent aminotransferase family protein [Steroidobacter sp.]|uniref:aminotransferase-like domain-containing protein n=1 Tax=Steroidobacter sp. TaxID=1978227 RepID=UPI002EDB0494